MATGSAVISDCGKYRYLLTRKTNCPLRWVKRVTFIMLNPSTADASMDDPTIKRCIQFAEREGCPDLSVVNLFAYRATHPYDLLDVEDPQGPENNKYLIQEIEKSQLVIAAWGAHEIAKCSLASELVKLNGLYCLGKTKDGSPRHPLYLNKHAKLVPL